MPLLQPLHNIAEICARKNISNAILCPGSRSAALTISFVRHSQIKTFSISDERSAAFIGMGMAQQTGKTVVLVCTSGTAVYNFASAITEAFFQEIPLLILTADRPKEWTHQQDGQTIYQNEIFGKHVKKSYELPADYSHVDTVWAIERIVNEAINISQTFPKGPVHINIPIREPFYPTKNEIIEFNKNVRIIKQVEPQFTLSSTTWEELMDIWKNADKKLIAVGQEEFLTYVDDLKNIQEELGVPVVGDVISNIHKSKTNFISAHDIFLGSKKEEVLSELQPDLLITCGRSFISKNLKIFLRKYKPTHHFHLQIADNIIDPFQTITHKIQVQPSYFFKKLFEDLDYEKFRSGEDDENSEYLGLWEAINDMYNGKVQEFINNTQFSDFQAIQNALSISPENSIFHLGNSMSVRYVNLVQFENAKNYTFFSNRGTSGIDGCLSTAVGVALLTETNNLVICLLGDVSFFYDRNALWNNYLPKNLRVIVMNNRGGNIFRIIDGPNQQPELEEYFETKQNYTAERTAADANMIYHKAENLEELLQKLPIFYKNSENAQLLEIKTDGQINANVFKQYKEIISTK